MQIQSTGAVQKKGFFDFLDSAAQFAIKEKFAERGRESDSDGTATELANPQTVSQPVTPSAFPGGQPNPPRVGVFGLETQQLLLLGIAALLVVVLFMLRR